MKSSERPEEASRSTRSYGVTAGVLTSALATAGVLTYAFFAVASHSLGADDYGALVILWSGVFIVISVVFRPIELLLARTVSEREAHGEAIAPALRVAGSIQLAIALVIVGVALVLRPQIEDQLLDGRSALFAIMLGAVLAYGGSYFGRGLLAGQRRVGLYAALLLIESSARLALAGVVAVGLADGVDVVALGVVAGPAVSLSVIPYALSRARPRGQETVVADRPPDSAEFTLGHGSAFAAALSVALLCEQILLSTGPLFVRSAEGTAAAGFMFNILLVARAPSLLFQAVAASLLPHLTRLRSTGDETSDEAFRLSVRLTLWVVVGFAVVVLLAVLAVGPQVMRIGFGDKFDYDRAGLAYMALGTGFYLAAATLNQAVVARAQARVAAACWTAAATFFLIWNLVEPLDVFRQVEVGFVISAAILFSTLLIVYRGGGRDGARLARGSAQELEANLAAEESL